MELRSKLKELRVSHCMTQETVAEYLGVSSQTVSKWERGFAAPDAVMTGPETRSSSPVRILRGEDRQAVLKGIYPSGEGAGYAGGIMSAAIDGIMSAESLIAALKGE